MGTIVSRKRRDKTTAYLAKISLMQGGQIYRENKTFDSKREAAAWIGTRELELLQPGAFAEAAKQNATLGDAITKYIETSLKEIGRTKAQVLAAIKLHPIAGKECQDIGSTEIVAYADELLSGGRQPQTVANYLSHLQSIFAIAKPAWNYPLDERAFTDAQKVLKRLGKIGRSNKRDTRPTLDQLADIMLLYSERQNSWEDMTPMTHIIAFAIFSTRRQEEICRIRWDDLDEKRKRVLVRDLKHPGQKKGNDTWCDLPDPCLDIIKAMPRIDDRIFPFNHRTVSTSFTNVLKFLEIDGLHFHDLRHDGISRLFEMDYSIPKAAAVSGHRSWNSLKRYTHLDHSGDKYAGWQWLPEVTREPKSGFRPPEKRAKVGRWGKEARSAGDARSNVSIGGRARGAVVPGHDQGGGNPGKGEPEGNPGPRVVKRRSAGRN
jgi:integrase